LLRILELEAKRGFEDAAVAGGLDLFLGANRADLAPLNMPESYASLSVKKREEWAREARASVEASPQTEVGNEPSPSPPKRNTNPAARPATSVKKPATRTRKKQASKKTPTGPVALETSIEDLPFITKTNHSRFRRLGVTDLRGLLRMYPTRHLDYSNIGNVIDLVYGEEMSVVVTVTSASTANIGRRGAARITARDDTGFVGITWFGQPYLAQQLSPGTRIVISGKVEAYRD
jgi:ATP-dependent DNA helicase RecG